MGTTIQITSVTDPSKTAWAVIHAEIREILESGMEPQELANRLGPMIDIIHRDLERLREERLRLKKLKRKGRTDAMPLTKTRRRTPRR